MCDVCVAEMALWTSHCKDKKCMAFEEGYLIDWSDAPEVKGSSTPRGKAHLETLKRLKRRPGKWDMIHGTYSAPGVRIRAKGKGAEDKGRGRFQIKLDGEKWPKAWVKLTRKECLADVVVQYGFDTKWKFVSKPVQQWILGQRKMPDLAELRKLLPKRKGKPDLKATIRMLKTPKVKGLLGLGKAVHFRSSGR